MASSSSSSSSSSYSSTTQNDQSSTSFPGFKKFDPKEEYEPIKRALSRLQRRAPRPLQLKPSVSFKGEGAPKMLFGSSILTPSSSSSPSSLTSFYQNNDPIPLLSPLVSPSFLDKSSTKSS